MRTTNGVHIRSKIKCKAIYKLRYQRNQRYISLRRGEGGGRAQGVGGRDVLAQGGGVARRGWR